MAFVSTRMQTIGGKAFKRGQVVPTELLTSEKASQLVGVRRLRETTPKRVKYVALRSFLGYKRGDLVNVSKFEQTKLSQMLEQRFLEPAISDCAA